MSNALADQHTGVQQLRRQVDARRQATSMSTWGTFMLHHKTQASDGGTLSATVCPAAQAGWAAVAMDRTQQQERLAWVNATYDEGRAVGRT